MASLLTLRAGLLAQITDQSEAIAVLVGAALMGAVMVVILLIISRSVRSLLRAANRLAQGDLSQRLPVSGPQPMAALAEALNQMAGQLEDRMATVVQQRNKLGAVLSSMVEGVLAIDQDERIISLNHAAAEMLQIDPVLAIGRSIQEVVRNTALHGFIAQTLRGNTAVQGELTLRLGDEPGNGERSLQVQSAILRDGGGLRTGAVIVLHDVTRVRRLEVVRRDFVANVSHEVRTPVSAIKAAVETLQSLQSDAQAGPEDADRFLKIIARQADRLSAIVDDLLSLARLEAETGRIRADLEPGRVAEVLRAACETCQAKAAEKSIRLEVRCAVGLRAKINAPLLEQAVVNLVDNAIKYSPADTQVVVWAEPGEQEVVVSVSDEGRGIEPEHLPRIFERFYRTDQARSRALGGTGLGLAIVKHVAEAHGGRVSVDSLMSGFGLPAGVPGERPGERPAVRTGAASGSVFRIHLLPATAEGEGEVA